MDVTFPAPSIPYLPGDSAFIRAAASQLRATIGQLDQARVAAVRLEAVTAGEHWRGEAFEIFRAATERKPLTPAVDRAKDRMRHAAEQLDWFASRFDENQDTIRWCRSRLDSLDVGGGVPEELRPAVQRIVADADQAWEHHRGALATVADTFDWLDDEPVYARPPPSTFDRVTGFVADVGIGLGRATVELVDLATELSLYVNPVTAPFKFRELVENRDQILAVLRFAWENPGEFLTELGRSLIDLDTLVDDGLGVWLGKRIPDIVLTLATGGLGRVGTGAAQAVRGLRGARVTDGIADLAGVSHALKPLRQMRGADDAAALLGERGIMNRLNRLGADADVLGRASDAGAFARTDLQLGRLARRFDELGGPAELLRQAPGALNDEIRGVLSAPARYLQHRYDGSLTVDRLTAPLVQRHFDNVVTNGLTGQLAIADGLLVGAPALSPSTRSAMASVLGASVLETVSGPVQTYRDLVAAAEARP